MTIADAPTISKPIASSFLARLFNVRWELGFYGSDPCDEWDIDSVLGLPDGLYYRNGRRQFQCLSCDKWTDWEGEVADFKIEDPNNLCGGSPRCCP